jgi:hypothetical protein
MKVREQEQFHLDAGFVVLTHSLIAIYNQPKWGFNGHDEWGDGDGSPTYLKAGSAAIAAGGAPEYVAYVAGQAEFCSRH